jgi:hypothetical protein
MMQAVVEFYIARGERSEDRKTSSNERFDSLGIFRSIILNESKTRDCCGIVVTLRWLGIRKARRIRRVSVEG